VARAPGLSVRLKLTLSYAGFLMVAGGLLLAAVWVFLLRGLPAGALVPNLSELPRAFDPHNFGPRVFGPAAAVVLAFLLVFGLLGGWLLAGRMLAPLTRITDATRTAATGSLAHRIQLPGRSDEFRELADRLTAVRDLLDRGAAAVVGVLSDLEETRGVAGEVNRLGRMDAVIHRRCRRPEMDGGVQQRGGPRVGVHQDGRTRCARQSAARPPHPGVARHQRGSRGAHSGGAGAPSAGGLIAGRPAAVAGVSVVVPSVPGPPA
jgi:HAMP domain-containing protein